MNFEIRIDIEINWNTEQKMKFSIKDFFSKSDQIKHFPVDLVTFTEEIFNEKLHL